MINASGAPTHILNSVNPPRPGQMARQVVLFRPFFFQKSLGLPITLLLAQIGANRVSSMMPDDCRGIETQRPAALLQTPADIHIVAGRAELRVKSPDRLETRLSKSDVASGNVFRLAVRK